MEQNNKNKLIVTVTYLAIVAITIFIWHNLWRLIVGV